MKSERSKCPEWTNLSSSDHKNFQLFGDRFFSQSQHNHVRKGKRRSISGPKHQNVSSNGRKTVVREAGGGGAGVWLYWIYIYIGIIILKHPKRKLKGYLFY